MPNTRDPEAGAGRIAELETLLDALPVGVGVVDSTRRFIRINSCLRTIIRDATDPEQLDLRRPNGERLSTCDFPTRRALAGETVSKMRVQFRTPLEDGVRWLAISATPLYDDTGAVTSAAVVMEDVTRASARDHAMRLFVTNAAHELGTPISGILASVESLQAGAKHEVEARDRFLFHVEREARRLQRLTRSLLTLARAQAGIERPDVEVVRVRPLLDDAVSGVAPAEGVVLEIDCDEEVAVLANGPLVGQAVGALVANATRYTADGQIRVSAAAGSHAVEIVVEDTGPGLRPDIVEGVFDGFWRAPAVSGDGFGLGLPIARDSARAAGGDLRLERAAGGGTRAIIDLPAARLVRGS